MNRIKAKDQILAKCEEVAKTLKSLSHPVRLKILCQIIDSDKNVCELAEFCDVSQSAMSQFLSRMREEGIIDSRKERTSTYYKICDPKIYKFMQAIHKVYC